MTGTVVSPGRVLCVCTANICRSPMTQQLLGHAVRKRLPHRSGELDVRSAGTRAAEGLPMAAHAVAVLEEQGVELSSFSSRALTAQLVGDADLVLCATREHRAAVVAFDPSASRRTFTTREFGFLIDDVSADDPPLLDATDLATRLRRLVKLASGLRGLRRPDRPEDFDLDDPYGQKIKAFRQTATLLDETLRRPLDLLTQQSAEPTAPAVARRSWWR